MLFLPLQQPDDAKSHNTDANSHHHPDANSQYHGVNSPLDDTKSHLLDTKSRGGAKRQVRLEVVRYSRETRLQLRRATAFFCAACDRFKGHVRGGVEFGVHTVSAPRGHGHAEEEGGRDREDDGGRDHGEGGRDHASAGAGDEMAEALEEVSEALGFARRILPLLPAT